MQVSDLFQKLSYGVFSNLSIGMDGAGNIAEDKKPKIVFYLNNALTQLHSRFNLKEDTLLIQQDGGIRLYSLTVEHALTNATVATKYIIDSEAKPFVGDLIKVLEVRDHHGCVLPLNDPESCRSVFTPQPEVIQVPSPVTGMPLGVAYQARHIPVPAGDETAEIVIPNSLEEALMAYIAYQQYRDLNTQESTAKAAEHLSLYEAMCSQVEARDLVNGSYSMTNSRFAKGGWV